MVTHLRALSARTPLRVKLVAALTALVAFALAVTGIAAATALRGYLVARVDANLAASVQGPGALNAGPPRGDRGGPRRPDEYIFQVSDLDGTVTQPFIVGQDDVSPPALPTLTAQSVQARAGHAFTVASRGGSRWRVLEIPAQRRDGTPVLLAVAAPLGDVDSTLHRLVGLEVVIGAIVLLVFAGLGYGAVRTSLRPLVEVERTAEAIAGGDLSQRVPESDPRTEVGRLAGSLNAMLGQIEQSFLAQQSSETAARQSEERMRRFVADASHELRTPLTSIRGFAELYRQGAVAETDELDRVMKRVEDEAARMGLLVDDLLLLARLDQQRPLQHEPVDLLVLAGDAAHDASAVDPDRDVSVEVVGDGAPVVLGDDARLRQVVGNLVTNALTHTPAGTAIRLRVGADRPSGMVAIEVSDSGAGLAPEEKARVFERFYRADGSRSRTHGGSGLGLSIVAALVAAHGGRVEVDSEPGHGATFRVLLPLAPAYAD
ncbi:MAG: two-component system, OmpR family, sensor kinase [Actinomycetota bacterium]|jgi:two-component system OmpR family sensor kinase|nr:two-component system, OmpR family, sensor kinase [Actinomycetota bacterium]